MTMAALQWRRAMLARLVAVDYGEPMGYGEQLLGSFALDSTLPFLLAADVLAAAALALPGLAAVVLVAPGSGVDLLDTIPKL